MDQPKKYSTILVTGGAGYVGSALVPKLLSLGYRVRVLDLYLYGEDVLEDHPNLEHVMGDIRNRDVVLKAAEGMDVIIHLACIANDASFELNPALGLSINRDAFFNILEAVRECKTKRFIYASSASLYGIQDLDDVTEEAVPNPLTDYSKYKIECEMILRDADLPEETTWTVLRPGTICGYTPRVRFDLVVNIFTMQALTNRVILVFGGEQLRPNIVVDDIIDAYVALLEAPREAVHRESFNAGHHNLKLREMAEKVYEVFGDPSIDIVKVESDDIRSYHINSDKIKKHIGFEAKCGLEVAINGVKNAVENNLIVNGMENPRYYNIKCMKEANLT